MRVAIYQQDIVWESPSDNYKLVASALSDMPSQVDMIVVPETFTTGFCDRLTQLAEPCEGATLDFARQMAKSHEALFVGTWPVKEGDDRVYNRLHWVMPDGCYGFYDKAHTFRMSCEGSQLSRGRKMAMFEWRGWSIRPVVCYDLRFPVWLRNKSCEDASALEYDMLVVCANWPASRSEAWKTLLRARAIENICYVVAANRVGADGNGVAYSGDSAVINYKGKEMRSVRCGDLIVVNLNKKNLDRFRADWPFYLDSDRFELKM